MTTNTPAKLGVLGFGDLGQRLFKRVADQYQCIALSRSDKPGPWQWRQTDAGNSQSLAAAIVDLDYLVISMVPQERSEQGYQQAYVKPIKDLIALDRDGVALPFIIFVSSTSVMHQNQGEWVDERSPCQPQRYNGQCLLEAEKLLQDSRLKFTVLRFSGIYGPGRHRLITMVQENTSTAKTELWTNRIHADDCAAVLAHLIKIKANGELFIGTDQQPVCDAEVKQFIAVQLGLAAPAMSEPGLGGKRCRNQKLLDSGYQFIHPSYQEGYKKMIREML